MTFLSNVNLCISQPRLFSQCLRPASVSGAVIWNTGCSTISECRHTSRRWGKGGASRECWGLGTACRDETGLKKTLVYVCWWGMAMKTRALRQARHFSNISLSLLIRNTELTWPIHLNLSKVFLTAVLTIHCLCALMPRLCGGLQGTVTSASEIQKWRGNLEEHHPKLSFPLTPPPGVFSLPLLATEERQQGKDIQKMDLAAPP